MARRTIKTLVLLAFITWAAAACNNDIFVEDPYIFQDVEAVMPGDNGSESFNIRTKGLDRITVDYYGYSNILTYYNHDNEVVKEGGPASELYRIKCETRGFAYDIYVKENRLLVHTIENAWDYSSSVTIRLEYGYITKFIFLTIEPGQPMEVASVTYEEGLDITEVYKKESHAFGFENNSPLAQQYTLNPYVRVHAGTAVVTPSERWAEYEKVTMKLPAYDDGTWQYSDASEVQLASTYYPMPQGWEFIEETVDIPAYSSVNIITAVTYSRAVSRGEIVFRTPVSGKEYPVQFTTEVIEPTSYEITVEKRD